MSKREPLVKIKISHLSPGQHHYQFMLAVADFQDAALSHTVFSNTVETKVTIDKGMSDMSVTIHVSTVVTLECDRCLAAPAKSVRAQDLQDEMRLLGKNDFEIDLTDDVRDTLLLALPMKNVCEPACSPSVGKVSFAAADRPSAPETEWQKALSQISQKLNLHSNRPKPR